MAQGVNITVDTLDRQLESLLTLKIKELISDDEFATRRTTLLNEKVRLENTTREREEQQKAAKLAVENALDFISNAQTNFAHGDASLRRAVVSALSSNLSFTRGKVLLEPHPLLEELRREHGNLAVDLERIKLDKSSSQSLKNGRLKEVSSVWGRKLNDVQTSCLHHSWFFPHLPAR